MSEEKNTDLQTPREPDFTIRVGNKVFKDIKDFVLILVPENREDVNHVYSSLFWADGACRQFRISAKNRYENNDDQKE